jgi:hypothetical protein
LPARYVFGHRQPKRTLATRNLAPVGYGSPGP